MSYSWIVVASSAEARIYERESRSKINLVHKMLHSESKAKGNTLASDRSGQYLSHGDGHGAFNERTDPKAYEGERFAHELANYLDQARNENKYRSLIIVAAPHFHGLLNGCLNPHVSDLVDTHLEKDFINLKDDEIASRLKEYV